MSTWISGIWLEVSALYVHLVHYELLIHPATLWHNAKKYLSWFYKQNDFWFRTKDE
jgi:hypothetical protein